MDPSSAAENTSAKDVEITTAWNARRFFWTTAVLFIVVVGLLAQTRAGENVAGSLGLAPSRATFTELYFADDVFLPDELPAGSSSELPLVVVIGNGAEFARTVAWRAEQRPTIAGLAKGGAAVRLEAGQTVRQTFSLPVSCIAPEIVLAVSVIGEPSAISHRIRCSAAVSGRPGE